MVSINAADENRHSTGTLEDAIPRYSSASWHKMGMLYCCYMTPDHSNTSERKNVTLMRGVYRFNIAWNVTIDWISVSAEIAPKNIQLADKIYIFGWNLAEPQKFRRRRGA